MNFELQKFFHSPKNVYLKALLYIDKTFLISTTFSINHNPPLISIVILWFERNSYRTKKILLHWLSGKLSFENMHMLKSGAPLAWRMRPGMLRP